MALALTGAEKEAFDPFFSSLSDRVKKACEKELVTSEADFLALSKGQGRELGLRIGEVNALAAIKRTVSKRDREPRSNESDTDDEEGRKKRESNRHARNVESLLSKNIILDTRGLRELLPGEWVSSEMRALPETWRLRFGPAANSHGLEV
jgi:hypothetical protein